jgi:hypothetical protein
MKELYKYLQRFGLVFLITIPIIFLVMGESAVKTMLYKICLVAIGWGLAELIWVAGYKFLFGKAEDLSDEQKMPVMVFRGMLFAAIILALTLGL